MILGIKVHSLFFVRRKPLPSPPKIKLERAYLRAFDNASALSPKDSTFTCDKRRIAIEFGGFTCNIDACMIE